MFPLSLIPWFFVIALVAPAAWALGRVYRRASAAHEVACPEAGRIAIIQLDARHAAAMHARGETLRRVKTCTFWPDRQGCRQACLKPPATLQRPRA